MGKSVSFFVFSLVFLTMLSFCEAQEIPKTYNNPILPGFNPDPSICRAGDDYYLVTSSFTWYPGLPIYHSKDLVHWKLIGHGIERPEQVAMNSVEDKNGIWAPTIRYDGDTFYIITTCNTCGGNFYITAKDPAGPWSDPIWLKDAPGIDPSLFWDDDGKCYYTGNRWDNKAEGSWSGQATIWIQEIDLKQNKFKGERKQLTFGHANNARYAEAPHIYKMNGKYILLIGEGGTDHNHAVTVHHSASILGPYVADQINPVLTHRHLGQDYPIHAIGHADMVQTANGDWWGVVLGKRTIDGNVPLGRETFLCRIDFEGNTPIFNAGYGKVLLEQQRPNLPWSPLFDDDTSPSDWFNRTWYTIRTPHRPFHSVVRDKLIMDLTPETLDSLTQVPILLQKVTSHKFRVATKLSFKTEEDKEQAGLALYRTTNSYYILAKEKSSIVLYKKFKDSKEILVRVPYNGSDVHFEIEIDNLDVYFRYGASENQLIDIGKRRSLVDLSDNEVNRFNGLGIGFYASSNGKKSKNKASYDGFKFEAD